MAAQLDNSHKSTEQCQSIPQQYQFLNQIHNKHLNCIVCKKLMINPSRLHPCGHTFCKKCIPKNKKCPSCLSKYQLWQPDLLALNLIGQINVKCKKLDCPWKGSLENFKKFHNQNCKMKQGGLKQWLAKLDASIDNYQQQKQQAKNLKANKETEIDLKKRFTDQNLQNVSLQAINKLASIVKPKFLPDDSIEDDHIKKVIKKEEVFQN